MIRKTLFGILFVCTAILFLSAFVSSVSASTLYVPDDYTTIQAAVDAAGPEDIIIVRAGTYKENVKVNKPHLTIKSENGADKTIVEAASPYDPIFEVTEDYVNIIGVTIKGSYGGDEGSIYLNVVHHCNIKNNSITGEYGIGIYLSESSNNNIINNTVSNKNDGIYLEYSFSNSINNNIILNNGYRGIFLYGGSKNIISNNTVSYTVSLYGGIHVCSRSISNSISSNTVSHNTNGIVLSEGAEKNTISNNVISHNEKGIRVITYSNKKNNISNNIVSSNFYGIDMSSWEAHVSDNIVSDNSYGIYLTGSSTKASGKNAITNNNVSNNSHGIYLNYVCKENIITNNNVSNNDEGIFLSDPKRRGRCSENIISYNNVSSNTYGIRLFGAKSNTITRNTANSNTYYGIYLSDGSSKNIITKNSASNNYNGIYITESSDNICYLNNFANKADNVYSYKSTNTWNSTEKITYIYNKVYTNYMGNYWSDYTGSDTNSDGIGDMPYSIDSDKDYYPLMVPWENYFAPIAFFTYSPEKPIVNQKVTFDASYSFDIDGNITNYEWKFGDGNTTNTTEAIISHSYSEAGNYTVNLTVTDNDGTMNSTFKVITISESEGFVFDTGEGTYPSIFGTHKGTIKPNKTIIVHKMYTYPCTGTGGHTEYVSFYGNGLNVTKTWNGYIGDYHNIFFDPPITLEANTPYNYEIRTGSYPQIIHEQSFPTANGTINCTQFTDANGKIYYDWIPAIKLE